MNVADAYWTQQAIIRYAMSEEAGAVKRMDAGVDGLGFDPEIVEAVTQTQGFTAAYQLANSRLYHVSADVDAVIQVAAETMPAGPIHMDDVPSGVGGGIVVWESSPEAECKWTHHTFHPLSSLVWQVVQGDHEQGINVTWYNDAPLASPDVPGWSEPIHPMGYDATVFGDDGGGLPNNSWVRAFWAFIEQELIHTTTASPRHARHDATRGNRPEPFIQVVRLRRVHHHASAPGEADVNWKSRWIVGGHWRNHWHPRKRRHIRRWIMPHVKGPEDKPLATPRPKVYDVSR